MQRRRREPKKVLRPRVRGLFDGSLRGALLFEPARMAALGGLAGALIAMLVYFVLHLRGLTVPPERWLLGVGLTFVIGYAATGLFVWYALAVAQREFPEEEERPRQRPASAEAAPEEPAQNVEESP